MPNDPESVRLTQIPEHPWRKWGPYLSERQWGTVREDYSPDGDAWGYFPHDHARSRAYRWGEDGLAGLSDDQQLICLSLALWNGRDPILKERLFGLTGPEGNHGEDVKELYYYLDATPTHSYLKMLYKYPQAEFPYAQLVHENARRDKHQPEFELLDTGIFNEDRYFDVFVEYAKASPEDILIRITLHNRGPEPATLQVLPQVCFRNTWSWTADDERPSIQPANPKMLRIVHPRVGTYHLHIESAARFLFTNNQTNVTRLYGVSQPGQHFKDAFHDFIIHDRQDALRSVPGGTKAAIHYPMELAPGQSTQLRLRLRPEPLSDPFTDFDAVMQQRISEADAHYAALCPHPLDEDAAQVRRQAFAGMIWSKQFYHFDVARWLKGDPAEPPPPPERRHQRDSDWTHLNNADVLSMPDKWEYPWFASWDLGFHCLPLATLDPEFAKRQLLLLTREWYMHPNGQLPAYEWAFGDVNPPVHAWAAWRVYQIDRDRSGRPDTRFLEAVFHKLLLNFTWWVNRKDTAGRNIFQGGFLGLDNIGVFDRSAPLPTGGYLSQCDGTGWMAMYCLNLMRIALELATTNPVYQDLATKFFEHFLYIAAAMTNIADAGINLWNEEDEFFYDVLCLPGGQSIPLKVRSMVGLIPLFAVEVLDAETLSRVPEFNKRLEWFLECRPDLASLVSRWKEPGSGETRLLSLLRGHRMKCLLRRMLDPQEFLSDYGVRALSRYHLEHPYVFNCNGHDLTVGYQPAESTTGLFGGNSNWRGPIWFPVNFLLIESLRRFHSYYGDDFKIECPTGSGQYITISQVADELARRLCAIFRKGPDGHRPLFGTCADVEAVAPGTPHFKCHDPHFRDHLLFYEYFHGETGRGVGASHQTGWTGLIALLLTQVQK